MTTLYLTNKMSAPEMRLTADLAAQAGAQGLELLAKAGNRGRAYRNVARDIQRAITRKSSVPEPYLVAIPITTGSGEQCHVEHPVLLPHELLEYLLSSGTARLEDLVDLESRVDQTLHKRHREFCRQHNLDARNVVALGFHGDGVPYRKATHKQASTEVLSWNLLCDLDGKRYLFADIHHEFLCTCGCRGRHTFDALLEVFAWSMVVLLGGHHPDTRHDRGPLDAPRAGKAGQPLGFQGVLLQARGDWAWFNQVFSFPNWNAKALCWRCRATQEGPLAYTKCGLLAAWRNTRYKPGEYLRQQVRENSNPSPLFACPGFTVEQVSIGALRCMDLGVTQDILGNILWEALHELGLPGRSAKERCKTLAVKLQHYYQQQAQAAGHPTNTSKLQDLTLTMIRKDYKSYPKLKAKGAETRALVLFGVALAQELHARHHSGHTRMVTEVVQDLHEIYEVMCRSFDAGRLATLSTQVADKFSKLEAEARRDGKLAWKVKPKLHMMQELLEYQSHELGNPRGYWEYRDEDFVGLVSRLAARKGGPATPKACARGVLQRYRALLGVGDI